MPLTTSDLVSEYLKDTAFGGTTVPTSSVVGNLIDIADAQVVRDITFAVEQEELTGFAPIWSRGLDEDQGLADGTNAVYWAKQLPIAEIDSPQSTPTVATVDVRVDVYDLSTDDWDEDVVISAVDPRRGKVTLDTAPGDGDDIFATYRYYIAGEVPDANLLQHASTNLTATMIWQNPEADVVQLIESWSLSGISISKGGQAQITRDMVQKYKTQFYDSLIRQITGGSFVWDG